MAVVGLVGGFLFVFSILRRMEEIEICDFEYAVLAQDIISYLQKKNVKKVTVKFFDISGNELPEAPPEQFDKHPLTAPPPPSQSQYLDSPSPPPSPFAKPPPPSLIDKF